MVLSGTHQLLQDLLITYNFSNDDEDRILSCISGLSKELKKLENEAK